MSTTPSNVLPLHLKQTFPPKIQIFTKGEGDGIDSRLSSKTFFTLKKVLLCLIFSVYYWIHRVSCRSVTSFCPEFFTWMPNPDLRHQRKRIEWCGYKHRIWKRAILQFSNLNQRELKQLNWDSQQGRDVHSNVRMQQHKILI